MYPFQSRFPLVVVVKTYAQNQPTPAGQVLIQNDLFTLKQLHQLGGVQLIVRVSLRSLLMHVGPVFFPIPVRP